MGLFSRKPKFRVEVDATPPKPGEQLRGTVIPTATSRETATTDVLLLARKLGRGAFVLAKVTDLELGADPEAWAVTVKEQLKAALETADLSGQEARPGRRRWRGRRRDRRGAPGLVEVGRAPGPGDWPDGPGPFGLAPRIVRFDLSAAPAPAAFQRLRSTHISLGRRGCGDLGRGVPHPAARLRSPDGTRAR